MSVDVLEGKVAFQNLEDHEFYQGQSTGKYSIVLSLDEKTSSNIFKEIYRLKKKKTLLIISHNTKNLYNCDYVLKFLSKKITINKKWKK